MIKEALQYLVGLDRPHFESVNGFVFCNRDLHLVEVPRPDAIVTNSLQGVIDYIYSASREVGGGVEGSTQLILHVANARDVRLITSLSANRRSMLIRSECVSGNRWRWGEYMTQESFIIAAKQSFVWDDELQRLLKLVSSLVEENQTEAIDNGVTQRVTMKHGVSLAQEELPEFFSVSLANWWPDLPPIPNQCFLRVQKGLKLALIDVCKPSRDMEMRMTVANWLRLQIRDYCSNHNTIIPIIV